MIGQQECNEILKQIPRNLEKSFHVGVSVIRKKRGIYPDAATILVSRFLRKWKMKSATAWLT